MAINVGVIQPQGSVGELTFYKRKGTEGMIIKKKAGPTKSQIMDSPAFIRTRENMKELGGCAKTGSWHSRTGPRFFSNRPPERHGLHAWQCSC